MPKKKCTERKPEAALGDLEPEGTHKHSQPLATSLGGTPVVAMPKYNPYARAYATIQEPSEASTPLRQSYEDLQPEARGPGSDEWRKADKLRADLTNHYNSLREDERYNEEYKSRTAWAEYEETHAQVEQLATEARQKMLRSADVLERMSIPTPELEGLLTKDTDKLLLRAHERSRIEGMLNWAEKQAEKSPFKRPSRHSEG
jgi:hypothetical protein